MPRKKLGEKYVYKELIISIVVVGLIILGNIITQNNTIKSVNEISGGLENLREIISKDEVDAEKSKDKMQEVEKVWEERYEKMAYYIEHNELEKVETELTKLKADIDMKEYTMGVENLDNCIFILKHIKDKTALKVVNIF